MSKRTKAKAAKERSESALMDDAIRFVESILKMWRQRESKDVICRIAKKVLSAHRATLARVDGAAKTGRAVSKAYAAAHPATTFRQAVGKGRGRKAV